MGTLTNVGRDLFAQHQGDGTELKITRFVLAYIPDLDTSQPENKDEVLPAEAFIQRSIDISFSGYVNPDQVVYSLYLGTDEGDFDFNWEGLVTEAGEVVAVNYFPAIEKFKTFAGQVGNSMSRNFVVSYVDAANITNITVPAEAWQWRFDIASEEAKGLVQFANENEVKEQSSLTKALSPGRAALGFISRVKDSVVEASTNWKTNVKTAWGDESNIALWFDGVKGQITGLVNFATRPQVNEKDVMVEGDKAANSTLWDGEKFSDFLNQDLKNTATPSFQQLHINEYIVLQNNGSIFGKYGNMIASVDPWLRLNHGDGHEYGIYCGTKVLRTDGTFQVGGGGSVLHVDANIFSYWGHQIWTAGNDGAGSGMDADFWDGRQFDHFLNQGVRTIDRPTFTGVVLNGDITMGPNALRIHGYRGTMMASYDEWLRINEGDHHTTGIYCGTTRLRTDGRFEVGDNGSTLLVHGGTFQHQGRDVVTRGRFLTNNIHENSTTLYASSHIATLAYGHAQTALNRANARSLSWGQVQISGFVNNYDEIANYTVPNGSVMVGHYSAHDGRTEDRRFRFRYRTLGMN
ncbi:phage tail protein [Marinibactrum halimedae]|uniref:Phage tail fibre protein N-terminal domain-containing protein n=1 Tax=Marinibactrum halimedae TaxID=1444977 RepID=A0AA37WPK0_9GAMM|nr:phage tail protein [Marinibactrum halimedae]MCD9458455.1 phage tail protein [Marinibactrum halimedae]GLS26152.1 hypothetical protein GCM10007877_18670 [Marinibactrum halimedae]